MGKPTGKKKDVGSPRISDTASPKGRASETTTPRSSKASMDRSITSKAFDEDTAIFINLSQELKEEGNRLFQKHDHEGAMLKYEKALKLLPRNHIDVAYLRSNMASCYMQLGLGEYPRAINECNLALEVSPKYSKALLKRARCYEALNRLDLALRDVRHVLNMEPNNLTALELFETIRKTMIENGVDFEEKLQNVVITEQTGASRLREVVRDKIKKKKKKKDSKGDGKRVGNEDKVVVEDNGASAVVKDKEMVVKPIGEGKGVTKDIKEERVITEDVKTEKVITTNDVNVEKGITTKDAKEETVITKTVKLVLGEDIRWAQFPLNCSIGLLRDIVRDRFPGLKGVLIKYRDQEGDLITITSTKELRAVESSSNTKGSLRFYITEVSLDQEPHYDGMETEEGVHKSDEKLKNGNVKKGVEAKKGPSCIEDWIVQFAQLFKNHVGFDSDSYLDLHELGMKLYSEAMEDTVTSEDAQELFDIAADKFQEMAALALFNWGNVHMSKARKRIFFSEDGSREAILAQVKTAYNWAKKEYTLAGTRYQEALKIKPDFYEGLLALGLQQFEQAKLIWCYCVGSNIDVEGGPSEEILNLYNKAEESMEKGMQIWEESEEQRLNGLSKFDKYRAELQKMGLEGILKDISAEEAAEKATNMSSQINLLWGSLLYERSVVEYRLELPTWEECLEVSVEKFELAGASPTDIGVMIKNHCSNETAIDGLGFKIDEIVQAWNEMYDAKRWQVGIPSFRLEPLFRRRAPKLHYMLEEV